jgi:hypothetical protein
MNAMPPVMNAKLGRNHLGGVGALETRGFLAIAA